MATVKLDHVQWATKDMTPCILMEARVMTFVAHCTYSFIKFKSFWVSIVHRSGNSSFIQDSKYVGYEIS